MPGKKDDRTSILAACRTHLDSELNQIKPRVVVALGKTALQALSNGTVTAITSWQGRLVHGKDPYLTVAAYHPSYIMRKPAEERRLTAALAYACELAGIPTKWNPPVNIGAFFNYDFSR